MNALQNQLNSFSNDISIFNSYLINNSSVIGFENNEIRCPEKMCYLIPEIKFIEENNQIKIWCNCEKKHEIKIDMIKFREIYHQSDINSVQCDNYKEDINHIKKADYFCFDCNKFECKECNSINHTGLNSKIPIIDYDTLCHKHLLPFSSFCKKCKINLCKKCEIEHKGDKFILLNEIKIDDDSLNIINQKIEKLKEENDSLAKKVSKAITEIRQKIESILFKYGQIKQYFDNMISIMNEIKNCYIRAKRNGKLNYSIKKNVQYLTEKDINEIMDGLSSQKKQIEEEIEGNKNANINFIKTIGNSSVINDEKKKDNYFEKIQDNFAHINIIKLNLKKQMYKARDRINQIGICPDGKIICISKCGDIFIFDNEGQLLKQTDVGKQYNSLNIIDNEKFIVCSNKIEFLSYNRGKNELKSLYCTEEESFSYLKLIYANNKTMFSCSNNNNIGYWLFTDKNYWRETQINHDNYNITSILLAKTKEKKLLISAGIYSMKFWNITGNNLILIDSMNNISCCNSNSLRMLSDDLIICGGILYIYIISLKNINVIEMINVKCRINSLFNHMNFFISGDEKGCLTIYNINNYKIIKKIEKAHGSSIFAIREMRNGNIITGGEDGWIKIWNY